MNRRELHRLDRELSEYLDSMVAGMGRTERREALRLYVTGLLLDGERKSIQPIAGRLVDSAAEIEGMRQRLQQCVSVASWSDDEMRCRLARKLDSELPGVEALVIDDTGFPKKGRHSVGVQRQYSGTLGRTDNILRVPPPGGRARNRIRPLQLFFRDRRKSIFNTARRRGSAWSPTSPAAASRSRMSPRRG